MGGFQEASLVDSLPELIATMELTLNSLDIWRNWPFLLFLIFANDQSQFAPDAHVVQYADDTQILVSGKKIPYPSSLLLWS